MSDDRKHSEDRLDRALEAWGRADPLDAAGDAAAIGRILGHVEAALETPERARRHWLPWLAGGGAAAASVAVALLLAPPTQRQGAPDGAPVAMAAAIPDEGASFALLYTPTIDEELIL
ncbi:MAG: hypothetical protein ACK4Z0_08810 [Sphingomonadaceae bacterium]